MPNARRPRSGTPTEPLHDGRRRFVGNTLRLPLAAFIASALPWATLAADTPPVAGLDAAQAKALERVLYLLYPFPDLGREPYARALAALGAQADLPALLALVTDGLRRLDTAAGTDWISQPEEAQLAALRAIETSPFFQRMLAHAQATLFNDPQVWKRIGYDGSSLEFGGYVNRGPDDMGWLDDAEAN